MGFINSASTVTVKARLTKVGREKILLNNNKIFSHFTLGDSDANYNTSEKLTTGLIPTNSGDIGYNLNTNDNISENVFINSKLYVTVSPNTKKQVEPNSSTISMKSFNVGETIVSGTYLTYKTLDKSDTSNKFTNLFKSLSLPVRSVDTNIYTGTTSRNGGWSDTPFSGLGVNNVLIGVIDNSQYGEIIDGKSIKIKLPVYTGFTSGGTPTGLTTYEIYSTYPKTTISKATLDSQFRDISSYPKALFANDINVSYLVSDKIQKPNNDLSKSWSTGYDTFKPFSLNGKE